MYVVPAGAFLAGLTSCVGPCVAPRFIAIAGIAAGSSRHRRWVGIGAFIGGLIGGYLVLGCALSVFASALRFSPLIYGALSALLAILGVRSLLACPRGECGYDREHSLQESAGAAFFAGGSFAFVLSPCCTPVLASLGALATSAAPRSVALTVACFAAGHSLPLAAAGCGANFLRRALESQVLSGAVSTVSGALMIALSGYYALLA